MTKRPLGGSRGPETFFGSLIVAIIGAVIILFGLRATNRGSV